MIRTVASVVFVLVMVTAGVGPVAAAAPTATTTPTDAAAPNAAIGTVPAQTGQTCSFPVTATDATGTEVTVQQEPERVVALGASTAQIMWDIGAREKVVGMPVNPTTAYLNGSESRTGIYQADQFTVATEQVVGLEPDLVLAPDIIPNETVQTLRGAGLTVYKFGFGSSLADVYDEINRTGRLIGACDGATETVGDTQEQVNTIQQAVEGEDSPRVLYPQSGGFVAGNGTFIHAVMETAGGDNIAANAGIQGYQQMSNETIAERDPEWIVASDRAAIPEGEPYASTTAVQQDQIIVVDSNLISQSGPRIVTPMTEIARQLHPEAMQATNLSNATATAQPVAADGGNATDAGTEAAVETETAVATDGGTVVETTAAETASAGETTDGAAGGGGAATAGGTETTSGDGAGFGVAAAAVALLGAALLARRRT